VPVEPVVPLCEQMSAQHNRAVETSGVRLSAWAFLQQSIPAISGTVHSCSLECRGIPADRPAHTNRISVSDIKRRRIALVTLWSARIVVKATLAQPSTRVEPVSQDIHGREFKLADYKGKVVLVNFWATWGQPCRISF
jgi:hypothetical protein